jgi:hypothetical protein
LGTTRCRNVIHPLDVLAYRLVRVPLLLMFVLCVVLFVCEMCVFVCVVLSCVELCVHSSREPAVLSLGFSLTCFSSVRTGCPQTAHTHSPCNAHKLTNLVEVSRISFQKKKIWTFEAKGSK